ncbi:serine hydrolase domain-containing protein [Streptomyces sp. TRM 70351]|uniref:serine hydrolase domain-containing protein n=1 Tax=Streptomyces sp. TRM 70351 TaxID=3116552 RepID=UPI002E7AD393|nr:serine hydrolase domain-containing protein [Streptomyces sp. TRM 70351]MEE1929473.1 serine hydrolase domain-containing protein [Streptomyces sp. TRM 70351]
MGAETRSTNGRSGSAVTDVQGTVATGYEPVLHAFRRNFTERGDVGAALTVYRDGRPVVDLWGGRAEADDPTGARAWARDTVQIVRSATKGPAAAVPHLLHQRGRLDLDAPVGTYWPEFKANGKDRVLVRHLLAHRAGLPALDAPLTPAQARDGVSGPRALAAQAPLWEPGTAHGYHAHTYGWLLGELVARATGQSLGTWFAREVAGPLGLDLWIGLPGAEQHRAGRIAPVPAPEPPPSAGLRVRPKPAVADAYRDRDSLTRRAFAAVDPAPDENDPAYRAAEHPASAGVGTARALARFYAALTGPVHGPVPGPRLYVPATLALARTEESAGPDRVLVVRTRFGSGYMLHGPASPMLTPASFGHPGRGGSLAFADPEEGIGFGYVTAGLQQSLTSDPRPQALIRALRGCLRTG